MTEAEFLIARARPYWQQGQPIPLDLFAEFMSLGLDVDAIAAEYQPAEEPTTENDPNG